MTNLRFREDGSFRVLQMADIQDGPNVLPDTIRLIREAIRKADPDLVVFTGDQIRGYDPAYIDTFLRRRGEEPGARVRAVTEVEAKLRGIKRRARNRVNNRLLAMKSDGSNPDVQQTASTASTLVYSTTSDPQDVPTTLDELMDETRDKVRRTFAGFLGPVIEAEVPFAATYGNHDFQCGILADEQDGIYREFPGCLNPVDSLEPGTFALPIEASDGSGRVAMSVMMVNSGDYAGKPEENDAQYPAYVVNPRGLDLADSDGYGTPSPEAIDWLGAVQSELGERNGDGKPVPAIAFQHIPEKVSQVVNASAGHAHPRLFPHITGMNDIAFLAGILLLFAGVEVHAVHAPELKQPQKQFPRAMFIAAFISFGLFTLGSLAVAIITPYDQINLQSGLFTTFDIAFKHYHVGWLTNVLSLLIAFGALASVMSWISGPSRGLLWTAKEGQLPDFMKKTNKNGSQINILLIQGCIVTVLSSLYIVMKDVSVAFFLLSALTIGLYLIMYMLMYAAGIRLRYTQPQLPRSYRVPGGNAGMWIIGGGGFLAVLFAFTVTFFPPSQLPVGSPTLYTALVATGTVIFLAIPIIISVVMGRRDRRQQQQNTPIQ